MHVIIEIIIVDSKNTFEGEVTSTYNNKCNIPKIKSILPPNEDLHVVHGVVIDTAALAVVCAL